MSLTHTLAVFEAFDSAHASGKTVVDLLASYGLQVAIKPITGPKGTTEFVRVVIPGTEGKTKGGKAPTLGIIGRLGGIGARPSRIGLVSDADGAVAAIATACKLGHMAAKGGDALPGDIIIATHICPHAPTRPHQPVDFMDSPVDTEALNAHEVSDEMDAILSIDTTKGNRILNHKGFALSPTVKEGYILRVSEDLVRLAETSTGRPAVTFPITTQDITPYGNGVYHLNSILQPSIATKAPVVGVAISAASVVPGCATGASDEVDIAAAVRFSIEVAKEFTRGTCAFYDPAGYARLIELYGSMAHLQLRK